MPQIVGVRFRKAGKLQYFDAASEDLESNDYVVCETPRGRELGWVVIAPGQLVAMEFEEPPRARAWKATRDDLRLRDELEAQGPEASETANELLSKQRLAITSVESESSLGPKLARYRQNDA